MFRELYNALREAQSFGAFLSGIFRRQRRFAYTPSQIHPIGESNVQGVGALARRDVQREREALIEEALGLPEGRQILAQAMVEPIRRSLEYQALSRRLLMVDPIPQGAMENPHAIQNRVDELRDQNRRFTSEIDRVIGLVDETTRNTRVHEIMAAPRFIELSFVTNTYHPIVSDSIERAKNGFIYPPIMCINKSDKKDLAKVKVLIL